MVDSLQIDRKRLQDQCTAYETEVKQQKEYIDNLRISLSVYERNKVDGRSCSNDGTDSEYSNNQSRPESPDISDSPPLSTGRSTSREVDLLRKQVCTAVSANHLIFCCSLLFCYKYNTTDSRK